MRYKKIYEMSGLKINVEKTKAIWISLLINSPTRLCYNYNNYTLDGTQGPFKLVGVTFSMKKIYIWDLNTIDINRKVEGLYKQWPK